MRVRERMGRGGTGGGGGENTGGRRTDGQHSMRPLNSRRTLSSSLPDLTLTVRLICSRRSACPGSHSGLTASPNSAEKVRARPGWPKAARSEDGSGAAADDADGSALAAAPTGPPPPMWSLVGSRGGRRGSAPPRGEALLSGGREEVHRRCGGGTVLNCRVRMMQIYVHSVCILSQPYLHVQQLVCS